MKKKTLVQEFIRIAHLKKHQKFSLSAKKRARRKANSKKGTTFLVDSQCITLNDADISNEMVSMSLNRLLIRDLESFRFPEVFDIFSDPEAALITIDKLRSVLLHPRLRNLKLNHKKVKQNSLGSEALLGLLTSEIISHRRRHRKDNIEINGIFPKELAAHKLVERIGLACELKDDDFKDASNSEHNNDVHLFRADNRYHESASLKSDKKREVAQDCVNYLEKCLNAHRLTIKPDAQDRLLACLGEILDNANEHCERTKSVWYVRSYFNDVKTHENKGGYLELMVLNFGNSISDNFMRLPEGSNVKKIAQKYVDRHKSILNESALFTVAALQGSMSSKRDLEPTRGQGTVTLIETFESIYNDYCTLRNPNGKSKEKAEMNMISGNTVVVFDGKYQSKVIDRDDGSELFQMSFNEQQSLEIAPDTNYVYSMKSINFPGLMINIRIPLKGSTEPLLEGVKND